MNDNPSNLPAAIAERPLETAPAPRTAAAIRPGGRVMGLIPQSFDEAWRIAQAMAAAGVGSNDDAGKVPENQSQRLMAAIMTGMELGVPPMAAASSIAVINGKPSVWGDLALALVENSGELEDFQEEEIDRPDDPRLNMPKWTEIEPAILDKWGYRCTVKRRGRRAVVSVFTIGDYRRADKMGSDKKTPLKTYPQRMLKMRARAWALRDTFSDVLKGISIREEAQDIEPAARARDVTPTTSGLANRLSGTQEGGFSGPGVDAELGQNARQRQDNGQTAPIHADEGTGDPSGEVEDAGNAAEALSEPEQMLVELQAELNEATGPAEAQAAWSMFKDGLTAYGGDFAERGQQMVAEAEAKFEETAPAKVRKAKGEGKLL